MLHPMADEGRQRAAKGVVGALQPDDVPSLDADAVRRSYQHHQARRRARVEHVRRSRRGGARVGVARGVLGAAGVGIAVTTRREIGRLFGL